MPMPPEWQAHYDAMTLGEATYTVPIACACAGGPPGVPLEWFCFCRLNAYQAGRLHRAAHIVAKLIDDAARKT